MAYNRFPGPGPGPRMPGVNFQVNAPIYQVQPTFPIVRGVPPVRVPQMVPPVQQHVQPNIPSSLSIALPPNLRLNPATTQPQSDVGYWGGQQRPLTAQIDDRLPHTVLKESVYGRRSPPPRQSVDYLQPQQTLQRDLGYSLSERSRFDDRDRMSDRREDGQSESKRMRLDDVIEGRFNRDYGDDRSRDTSSQYSDRNRIEAAKRHEEEERRFDEMCRRAGSKILGIHLPEKRDSPSERPSTRSLSPPRQTVDEYQRTVFRASPISRSTERRSQESWSPQRVSPKRQEYWSDHRSPGRPSDILRSSRRDLPTHQYERRSPERRIPDALRSSGVMPKGILKTSSSNHDYWKGDAHSPERRHQGSETYRSSDQGSRDRQTIEYRGQSPDRGNRNRQTDGNSRDRWSPERIRRERTPDRSYREKISMDGSNRDRWSPERMSRDRRSSENRRTPDKGYRDVSLDRSQRERQSPSRRSWSSERRRESVRERSPGREYRDRRSPPRYESNRHVRERERDRGMDTGMNERVMGRDVDRESNRDRDRESNRDRERERERDMDRGLSPISSKASLEQGSGRNSPPMDRMTRSSSADKPAMWKCVECGCSNQKFRKFCNKCGVFFNPKWDVYPSERLRPSNSAADREKRIRVDNVPTLARPADLANHFNKYGNVVFVNITSDQNSSGNDKYGFVSFADVGEVRRVIKSTHIVKGRTLKITSNLKKIEKLGKANENPYDEISSDEDEKSKSKRSEEKYICMVKDCGFVGVGSSFGLHWEDVHSTFVNHFICPVCDTGCILKSQLRSHLIEAHGVTNEGRVLDNILSNVQLKEKRNPKFIDPGSVKKGGKSVWTEDMAKPALKVFKCPEKECPYSASKVAFLHHWNSKHMHTSKCLKCAVCDVTFIKRELLINHFKVEHKIMVEKQVKPVVEKPAKVPSKASVEGAEKISSDEDENEFELSIPHFMCKVVGCQFRGPKIAFKAHWRRRHEFMEKYLACPYCGLQCGNKAGVRSHMLNNHDVKRNDPILDDALIRSFVKEKINPHYMDPGRVGPGDMMEVPLEKKLKNVAKKVAPVPRKDKPVPVKKPQTSTSSPSLKPGPSDPPPLEIMRYNPHNVNSINKFLAWADKLIEKLESARSEAKKKLSVLEKKRQWIVDTNEKEEKAKTDKKEKEKPVVAQKENEANKAETDAKKGKNLIEKSEEIKEEVIVLDEESDEMEEIETKDDKKEAEKVKSKKANEIEIDEVKEEGVIGESDVQLFEDVSEEEDEEGGELVEEGEKETKKHTDETELVQTEEVKENEEEDQNEDEEYEIIEEEVDEEMGESEDVEYVEVEEEAEEGEDNNESNEVIDQEDEEVDNKAVEQVGNELEEKEEPVELVENNEDNEVDQQDDNEIDQQEDNCEQRNEAVEGEENAVQEKENEVVKQEEAIQPEDGVVAQEESEVVEHDDEVVEQDDNVIEQEEHEVIEQDEAVDGEDDVVEQEGDEMIELDELIEQEDEIVEQEDYEVIDLDALVEQEGEMVEQEGEMVEQEEDEVVELIDDIGEQDEMVENEVVEHESEHEVIDQTDNEMEENKEESELVEEVEELENNLVEESGEVDEEEVVEEVECTEEINENAAEDLKGNTTEVNEDEKREVIDEEMEVEEEDDFFDFNPDEMIVLEEIDSEEEEPADQNGEEVKEEVPEKGVEAVNTEQTDAVEEAADVAKVEEEKSVEEQKKTKAADNKKNAKSPAVNKGNAKKPAPKKGKPAPAKKASTPRSSGYSFRSKAVKK